MEYEKNYNDFEQGVLEPEISPIVEHLYASEDTKKLRIHELSLQYLVDEKALLRKIDFYVVCPFALIVFVQFLCRSNIGILQIEGIYRDLGISEIKFFSAYAAFFAPYIAFQFVSNIILKRVRPHFWISFSVIIYGAITMCTGWVSTYGQFVACQFLHGLFQSGVETALYYILAQYYEKSESQTRFSFIYSFMCVAGAVSTAIAYSIDMHVAGKNGWEGWRWLLIVEGAIAMVVAFILFFVIPDFPENARFMDDDETTFLVKKLEIYQGKSGFDLEVQSSELLEMFLDPLVIYPAIASLGLSFATYCYAFFEAVLTDQIIGGTVASANKHSIFPWLTAFGYVNLCAYLSDQLGFRFPFAFGNCLLTVVGGALMFTPGLHAKTTEVNYAGCFVLACAGYAAIPSLICWTSTNLGGHTRKNIGITMMVSFGSLGGMICIFPFIQDASKYTAGYATGFAFLIMGLVAMTLYLFELRKQNRIKRTNEYKVTFSELSQRKQIILGDKNPAFDYLY